MPSRELRAGGTLKAVDSRKWEAVPHVGGMSPHCRGALVAKWTGLLGEPSPAVPPGHCPAPSPTPQREGAGVSTPSLPKKAMEKTPEVMVWGLPAERHRRTCRGDGNVRVLSGAMDAQRCSHGPSLYGTSITYSSVIMKP